MRILAAADLHYRLPHYDWLLEQASDFDVVALPGDHLDVKGAVPIEAQTVVLSQYFERFASVTQFLISSGNHDLDGPGPHGEQIPRWLSRIDRNGVHVDGSCVDIGGTRFTLCPWWDGPVTNAEVAAQFEQDAVGRPERWIWLYHSPPAGTGLCRTGQREFPDHDLTRWIDQWSPDLVFTGHIHQAPWVEGGAWAAKLGRTWVFNAGRTIGPVPAHIIVDTEAGTAEWYGLPDRDQLSIAV
ncbi:MAG: metallophosphoesterase [Acidimicrobiia bacterium]|nr:metallophosphoesterase [Acidimicrobiia bacterium]